MADHGSVCNQSVTQHKVCAHRMSNAWGRHRQYSLLRENWSEAKKLACGEKEDNLLRNTLVVNSQRVSHGKHGKSRTEENC